MKSLLFLFILFIISLPTFSQGTQVQDRTHLGMTSSVYFYEKSYKGFLIPHFEVRKNTQAISLGATILTTSEFDASDRKYPKLTGIEVGYKFYPTITRHKVDFYLHAS